MVAASAAFSSGSTTLCRERLRRAAGDAGDGVAASEESGQETTLLSERR